MGLRKKEELTEEVLRRLLFVVVRRGYIEGLIIVILS